MFEKNNTSKNISLTVNDITVDTNPIYLNSTNFMFGIGVFSEYKYISDETYVSMSIIQHNFIGSADSPTTYKLEAWSNNNIFNIEVILKYNFIVIIYLIYQFFINNINITINDHLTFVNKIYII